MAVLPCMSVEIALKLGMELSKEIINCFGSSLAAPSIRCRGVQFLLILLGLNIQGNEASWSLGQRDRSFQGSSLVDPQKWPLGTDLGINTIEPALWVIAINEWLRKWEEIDNGLSREAQTEACRPKTTKVQKFFLHRHHRFV